MVAPGVVAATSTAPGRAPQLVHAFCVENGLSAEDIEVSFERFRAPPAKVQRFATAHT